MNEIMSYRQKTGVNYTLHDAMSSRGDTAAENLYMQPYHMEVDCSTKYGWVSWVAFDKSFHQHLQTVKDLWKCSFLSQLPVLPVTPGHCSVQDHDLEK